MWSKIDCWCVFSLAFFPSFLKYTGYYIKCVLNLSMLLSNILASFGMKRMLYYPMSNSQLLHHYQHFNVVRYCIVLYRISSYESDGCLLPPPVNYRSLVPALVLYSGICKCSTRSSGDSISAVCQPTSNTILKSSLS